VAGQTLDDNFMSDVSVTVGDNTKYDFYAGEYTQSSSHVVKVGEEIKAKIYLQCVNDDYRFTGSYSSSNVKVTNGTFVSATRKSDDLLIVTVKLKAVNGEYDSVDDAYWTSGSLGHAKWEAPDDTSGYYDIILYRGSSSVYSTYSYKGTSINLYPYMTKEGDYHFKVRVVPKASGKGKKSDWTESDYQYVSAGRVSDGSGQSSLPANGSTSSSTTSVGPTGNSSTNTGWVKSGTAWYYVYPDGTTKKNGWEKISNYWYYFGSTGALQTGWLSLNGQTYYLDPSTGVMQTGWTKVGDAWYYMNNDQLSSTLGATVKSNWVTDSGNVYYMTSTGAMAVGWNKIGDKYYYFTESGDGKGRLVRNSYVGTFYVGADGAWIQNF
jgi:glucan-binding YG repeat protein